MKKFRYFISMMLVSVTLVSVMAIPVSAADIDWQNRIAEFQQLSQLSRDIYPDYTIPLQQYLICFNDICLDKIMNAGGVDGYFGTATGDAVEIFQRAKGLTADRIVGSNTWRKIASTLRTEYTYGVNYKFTYDDCHIIQASETAPYEFRYYTYLYGDIQVSHVFHTSLR